MSQPAIRPFKVDISHTEVDRLKAKVADTRMPGRPIVPDAGENYGRDTKYPSFIQERYRKTCR